MLRSHLLLLAFILAMSCHKSKGANTTALSFDSVPIGRQLVPQLNEVSGIVDSRANPGHLWLQEDSGNPPVVHLLQHDGHLVKSIYVKNAVNRDWEDICLTNGQLYIGDIGDNNLSYSSYTIYKFQEPSASVDTIRNIESINFTYPDGSHDAEAFLVDSASNDIYIITKRDNPSRIYKLSYPYGTSNQATLLTMLPYSGVVSAAISPNRDEMIIKTYTSVYGYNLSKNSLLDQAFSGDYKTLRYQLEPQGEAVSFDRTNSGFYTLSEKGFGNLVSLYFYPRR